MGPDQAITRAEALRCATINGAYLSFDEDKKGSLEPGKLADLAVLSGNKAVGGNRREEVGANGTRGVVVASLVFIAARAASRSPSAFGQRNLQTPSACRTFGAKPSSIESR